MFYPVIPTIGNEELNNTNEAAAQNLIDAMKRMSNGGWTNLRQVIVGDEINVACSGIFIVACVRGHYEYWSNDKKEVVGSDLLECTSYLVKEFC